MLRNFELPCKEKVLIVKSTDRTKISGSEAKKMRKIVVKDVDEQDKFLTDYVHEIYPNSKYEEIYSAFLRAEIKLNGKIIKEDVFVENGDEVELNLFFYHLGLPPVLDILYEDENFLAIEKMPGVLSFDEYKTGEANVYDMALEYMLQKGEYNVDSLIVPYLCYTLPQFAGGILFIAKNEEAYLYINAGLKQRKVHMVFEAIVVGHPKMDETEEYHHIDNRYNIFPHPQPGSLPIVTRYKCINKYSKYTKVEIVPITIRKYQVYAHMAYLGCPILGDNIFGSKRSNRKSKIDYEVIWLKELSFSVGSGSMFSYLSHVNLKMDEVFYPNVIYKKGRKRRND